MVLVFAVLLLLVSGSSSPDVVHAAEDEHSHMVVAITSLKAGDACFGHRVTPPAVNRSTWLPLELPPGPCSALQSSSADSDDADMLRRDQRRADDLQSRLSREDDGKATGPSPSSETDVQHNAIIAARVGTKKTPKAMSMQQQGMIHPAATGGDTLVPGVIQHVVLDTASDVPWVQCVPCPVPPCHPQTDTFYDPANSGTYSAFSCNSTACTQLGPYANGCVNNQCQYRVTYPDGSSTSGTYSSDRLTLNPTTRISNFQFGCSHVDQGNFDTQTAGIMALGGGPESLASQTAATYGTAFSYCLPPTASYLGYFILGAPSLDASSSRYVVTPMLRDTRAPATFYRVLLRAITVSGQRLNVPAAVFATGSVLDSRTVITRLPPTAYRALRAAFVNGMRMYRRAPPKGILDTCYDFTGVRNVRLPRIALVFDRADAAVELDPSGILFNDCLAFAANKDDRMPGIIGNVQQQTIEVVYDVGGGAVGFRRNAC